MSYGQREIQEMVDLAKKWSVELVFGKLVQEQLWIQGASVHTPEGQRMGYRLRGQEQIVRAAEDVKRAARLGCRSFLVYDEGCLWL